jgi:superfamily II DNA or RNA helicase
MVDLSAATAQLDAAPPLSGYCLDALLLLDDQAFLDDIGELLHRAGFKRENGRAYTLTQLRKAFGRLRPLIGVDHDLASVDEDLRYGLLGHRGGADNPTLIRLARARYQQLDKPNRRGRPSYYFRPSPGELAALALLANDAQAFGEQYRIATQPERQVYYSAQDSDFLYGLLDIDRPDFWNWRASGIQAAFLNYQVIGLAPDLQERMAATALDILTHQDFLDLDRYRPAELAGVLLIDRVASDPALRSRHFDLDLLADLLLEETIDEALLLERVHTLEGAVHFVDVIFLAAAYRAQLVTAKELDHLLRANTRTQHPLGLTAFRCWVASLGRQNGAFPENEYRAALRSVPQFSLPDALVISWVSTWLGLLPPDYISKQLWELPHQTTHLPWPHGELCTCLLALFPTHPDRNTWRAGTQVPGEPERKSLANWFPAKPRWETALARVETIVEKQGTATGTGKEETPAFRTIWIVNFERGQAYAKEQKLGKGGYSKGRRLKWEELFASRRSKFRTSQDLNALAALTYLNGRPVPPGGHVGEDYVHLNFARLIYELADHPRLYLGERERNPITLTRERAAVQVEEREGRLEVRFDPPPTAPGAYQWKRVTPTRYAAYQLNDRQRELAEAIGYGLSVPTAARERLEASLEGMRGAVSVQSDTDLVNSELPQVEGAAHISVHLLPRGEGYQIEFLARPLASQPLYFPPGRGMLRSQIATENGPRILLRDLEGEKRTAADLIARCPSVPPATPGHYEWRLEDETACLRFLLELRRLVAEGSCTVEYPKGEKLRLATEFGADDLALKVGKQRDWFSVSGHVRVDEDRVVDLQALIQQVRDNDTGFVQLREGEFAALTEDLRDRIRKMEGYLQEDRSGLHLSALAAEPFAAFTEDMDGMKFDGAWRANLDRIRSARHLRPAAPSPFAAELRTYQREGYDWMLRLAAWGVGACLADDMGLGKTVQALAVLTQRREAGPALVLAPASVIRNWRSECERFAPALRPVLLAKRSDTYLIEQVGAGDLLLVSYGLITYVADELATRDYATIVLDEAQAIKNYTTKRARAVRELGADFRIATTGTPIENNLSELWSLFRFLNPGLLGTRKAFNEKYALPISRDDDALRREQLRRLVQPFILRRRKDEVLKELPAKTEIVLTVQPGPEETALYEALRREAVREIEEAPPEERRFNMLGQLTKLRQAACHPRLVRPNSTIPSAKLELVGETILELLENGHTPLIFSQFVRHLKLVEDWVKQQKIAYQYLDGSTPGRERERRVNAFQEGEGRLFLISLKAGGTGLNLTAADYVLHLDPWWNPAAEDQASDRAHRIGQQKPVTVYRFVTAGTIEERVVALHAEKRDLADSILAGTGRAARLEVDEILEMLTN